MGGPGAVVPFGLLLAGVAVSAGLSRLLPRWMMWSGLVPAAAAELSTLALVWPAAALLLPCARFLGMAWLIAAGALLPGHRSRPGVTPPTTAPRWSTRHRVAAVLAPERPRLHTCSRPAR